MRSFRVSPGLSTNRSANEKLASFIVGSAFGKDNASAIGAVQRLGAAVPKVDTTDIDEEIEVRFKLGMRKIGLFPPIINTVWRLAASGISAERNATGPHSKFWNESFDKLASQLRCLNLLDPSDRLALWSGGIAISQYARKLGYCCLETTRAGEMLDSAKLYNLDKSLWNLWDYLARAFVDQVRGYEVHIFVRNIDRKSTLLQVEVPHLLTMERDLQIKWHVIVDTDTGDLRALTRDGEPKTETTSEQFCFDTRFNAEIALRAYVMASQSLNAKDKERWKTLYPRKDLKAPLTPPEARRYGPPPPLPGKR